eukprot:2794290-Rhodomonas_salina.2
MPETTPRGSTGSKVYYGGGPRSVLCAYAYRHRGTSTNPAVCRVNCFLSHARTAFYARSHPPKSMAKNAFSVQLVPGMRWNALDYAQRKIKYKIRSVSLHFVPVLR